MESLAANLANAAEAITAAQSLAIERGDDLALAERALEKLTADLAEWNAKRHSHLRAREIADALAETSAAQLSDAGTRRSEALARVAAEPDVRASEAAVADARARAFQAREAFERCRDALRTAQQIEDDTRAPLEAAERDVERLGGEAKALRDLLRPHDNDLWPPLIDSVRVEDGYEAALAAALGDSLDAPLDEAAPAHWRDLGPADSTVPLPAGVSSLAEFVAAPAALTRRLLMTGVVAEDAGTGLQATLSPGQRLVSKRGDLWRWDGYAQSAESASPTAQRLAQRNRLAALELELTHARGARGHAQLRHVVARQDTERAREAARAAEESSRTAEDALTKSQDEAAHAARVAAERAQELATFDAEIRRLIAARDAARESARSADEALAELGNGEALADDVDDAREAATGARHAHLEARAALESLKRDRESREARRATLAEDETRWQKRRDAALRQIEELNRRLAEFGLELHTLENVPVVLAQKRSALLDAVAAAEAARAEAADARATAENHLLAADRAAKSADAALALAREERARAEATTQSAEERLSELVHRIREELDMAPDALAEYASVRSEQSLPTLEHAEKRVEKLKAEREQLGGVNLRAEEEAAECGTRVDTMQRDRADLDGAIQRLRRGIQSLNREGRERLLESFEKVNANFQQLFSKLFEGGEARLTLTESEDPLEAGLEIYARPPGKRLQSLSLLSGGEQALTALALIFAVFLVNPAPVCVLDEVDAPLDDANVERFCNLMDEMRKLADTRFVVITHHALTMSRVDRLFGVTMAERGISQLVSVTLSEAERVIAAE
jgi:chromosome segregation protein